MRVQFSRPPGNGARAYVQFTVPSALYMYTCGTTATATTPVRGACV